MNAPRPDIIVGSGPSGLAAARARLEAGAHVLMLDGGRDLEPEAEARRAELADGTPDTWSRAARLKYMAPGFSPPPGQSRRFGSDFAQEKLSDTVATTPDGFGLRASRAIGGLSNLWGAAVLPNRDADMAGWPVTAEDLAPHYDAVADIIGLSGDSSFDELFPAFAPKQGTTPLPASTQIRAVLSKPCADPALTLGPARVAVSSACKSCGLCLHGCPWGYIFSARPQVAALTADARFSHRPNAIVTRIEESPDGVVVYLKNGESLPGSRVFVAAGVLETARIAFASAWARTLTLHDSQHGFLPFLTRTAAHPAAARHTLAAVFAELDDPALSPYLIHSQLYGYNEFYAREMQARYGRFLPGLAGPLFRRLARHLVVAQTFLHSDHSARITLSLAPDGRLDARLHINPETQALLRQAQRRLAKALRSVGLHALLPAAHAGIPGSSFHAGGTLPMRSDRQAGKTDPLGRPNGCQRIHVVDASVLPAIAATTITFTVMANAHRIAAATPT